MININHYIRQMGLANPDNLTKDIGIIGAGSIGSWTTYALLKMGCQKITVYDFDKVEEPNIGSQIYTSTDIGKTKLEALASKMMLLTEGRIETREVQITKDNLADIPFLTHDILIMAVDNIETRTLVFNNIPKPPENWLGTYIDARMAGNALEIYTIPMNNVERIEYYKTRLFPPEHAVEVDCSMKSVVYNVFVVGGLIADMVAQLSRGELPPQELVVDLRNFTMEGGM